MQPVRIFAITATGLGLAALGVALWVAPPHAVAEASPPPNSDIPLSLICRSGGNMTLELGPKDSYLHYKIRPGVRPKSLKDIQPGECASGNPDIPLGSATTPTLHINENIIGCRDAAGFSYSVGAGDVTPFSGVAQGCASGDVSCKPSKDEIDLAASFETFAVRFRTPGSLFQIQTRRDPYLTMSPNAVICRSLQDGFSFPKDI